MFILPILSFSLFSSLCFSFLIFFLSSSQVLVVLCSVSSLTLKASWFISIYCKPCMVDLIIVTQFLNAIQFFHKIHFRWLWLFPYDLLFMAIRVCVSGLMLGSHSRGNIVMQDQARPQKCVTYPTGDINI